MDHLEDKQLPNLLKRNSNFLFFSRRKFFDFCTSFSSEILGYQNKFISSKIKSFSSKKNDFHVKNNKNYINCLLKRNVSLQFYENYFLNEENFIYFVINYFSEDFNFEPIEAEKINKLKKFQQLGNQKRSNEKFEVFTDLYLLFNDKKYNDKKKILWIDSTFPNLKFFPIDDFDVIIVGGRHPFGLGNSYLFFCRGKYKELLKNNVMPWHASVYQHGLNHFFYKKQSKLNSDNLKYFKTWINSIQKLETIEKVIGTDFFYKILLKDKKKLEKNYYSYELNHFFLKKLHFLYYNNYFYILLASEVPHNLLKNRLRDVYNWLL